MKIIRDSSEWPLESKAAVSIGNFDGIHAGHRALVSVLVKEATKRGLPSVVVTFDPHPIEILVPGQSVLRLTSIERRAELLGKCGVDYLAVLPTQKSLLELDYRDFFTRYIVETYKAQAVVEGPNFFFGRDREGNLARLKELCEAGGIELLIVDIAEDSEGVISSTAIRDLVLNGELSAANQSLVDEYQIEGDVVRGASRGRQIGFPTANLENIQVLVPAEGVYAGWTHWGHELVPSAIHVGPNPTFGEQDQKVEVHLIDHRIDLYDQRIKVDFVARVRGIKRFSGQQDLIGQIKHDVEQIKSILECPA